MSEIETNSDEQELDSPEGQEVLNARKEGRWSKAEEKYMAQNYKSMTIEDISCQLNRNPATVERYIKERFYGGMEFVDEVKNNNDFDITKTPIWKEIKRQFSAEEQSIFLYNYSCIVNQFKYDVLPTERMQIIEVGRLDILISRALEKINEIRTQIDEINKEINRERELGEHGDRDRILQLETNRVAMNTATTNFSKDYKELLDKRASLFREIKGTREQRIKRIEDSKETLGTYIASLIENTKLRRDLGIEIEKVRLASEVELKRLSEYHTYLDGQVEQPILCAETIKEDNN